MKVYNTTNFKFLTGLQPELFVKIDEDFLLTLLLMFAYAIRFLEYILYGSCRIIRNSTGGLILSITFIREFKEMIEFNNGGLLI